MWQPSPRTDFPACHPQQTLVILGSPSRFVPAPTKFKSIDFRLKGLRSFSVGAGVMLALGCLICTLEVERGSSERGIWVASKELVCHSPADERHMI